MDNWTGKVRQTDRSIFCCVISGSVSGVADSSVLVGYDSVQDVSKDRFTSIFRNKKSCWTALHVCVTRCELEGEVALMSFRLLQRRIKNFWLFLRKLVGLSLKLVHKYSFSSTLHAVIIPSCNSLCGANRLRTDGAYHQWSWWLLFVFTTRWEIPLKLNTCQSVWY